MLRLTREPIINNIIFQKMYASPFSFTIFLTIGVPYKRLFYQRIVCIKLDIYGFFKIIMIKDNSNFIEGGRHFTLFTVNYDVEYLTVGFVLFHILNTTHWRK